LFVLPAVLESFGIAALQARAAGLPVVARREGGVGGFVRHGHDGLLAGSDQEMGDLLVSLLGEPGALERLRLTGSRSLRHGWTQVMPLYARSREVADRLCRGGADAPGAFVGRSGVAELPARSTEPPTDRATGTEGVSPTLAA